MNNLISSLQTDTDVVVLVSGLLNVITVMPIIPVYVSPYVNEIFEVFRYDVLVIP